MTFQGRVCLCNLNMIIMWQFSCWIMQLGLCFLCLQQHYQTMSNSAGVLDPPLGNTRLQIARLISTLLLLTNRHCINVELANLGTTNCLLVSGSVLYRYLQYCLIVVCWSKKWLCIAKSSQCLSLLLHCINNVELGTKQRKLQVHMSILLNV